MGIKVKDGVLLITIDDEIGGWFGGISSKEITDGIEVAKGQFTGVKTKINSPGGDVFEGIAIRAAILDLVDQGFIVDVEVVALAASIASVIALSGSSLKMRVGARFMIHEPSTFAGGDWRELRSKSKMLEGISGDLIDIYEDNSTIAREEVKEAVAAETWYSAKEAVAVGFASAIITARKGEILNKNMEVFQNSLMMDSFKNVPEDLFTRNVSENIDDDEPDSTEEISMNLKEATTAHPAIQKEVDAEKVVARGEGAQSAVARLTSLLALTDGVLTPEVQATIDNGGGEAELALAMVKAGVTPNTPSNPAEAITAALALANTTPEAITATLKMQGVTPEEIKAVLVAKGVTAEAITAALATTPAPIINTQHIPIIAPISDLKTAAEVTAKADEESFDKLMGKVFNRGENNA